MTPITSNNLPLYFKVPTHDQLEAKVGLLNTTERSVLEGAIYTLAKKDGVLIEGWDKQWGKHHILDNDSRLITAFLKQIKVYIQSQAHCSENTAELVIQYCPCVDEVTLNEQTLKDLVLRAKCLTCLDDLKNQLNKKYPELGLYNSDSSPRVRGWIAQETFLLTVPVCLTPKEMERFNYFASVVQELINGQYDTKSAELILDKLLERESNRPSSPHLESHIRLLQIKKIANEQINGPGLNRADESLYKDLFVVPRADDKQGKFKPLHLREATKETYAYQCDRMLGIGMTAPTMMLKTGNLAAKVETIRKLFQSAATSANRTVITETDDKENITRGKDISGAHWLRQKAFSLFNENTIPQEVRNSIFAEMFHLCGDHRAIDRLGELLLFNSPGFETTDKQKECAIQNYMRSPTFKDHQSKFSFEGSIQLWLNDCDRVYDYIVKDKEGGTKLKSAPKTLVHFSALLGILKGSMDCSSGNNLIEFEASKAEVVNFWDMDDERSMPTHNDFWHIRLWQMGLPQCAQPFDKAFLLLFSDESLVKKLKQLQNSPQISHSAYQAQIQRLITTIDLFNSELQKSTITLTPRELFFTLFDGREHYNYTKKKFNDDKTYSSDGIRISPIELFEFHLPEMGRSAWYTGDEDEKKIVGQNMAKLYSPELP